MKKLQIEIVKIAKFLDKFGPNLAKFGLKVRLLSQFDPNWPLTPPGRTSAKLGTDGSTKTTK